MIPDNQTLSSLNHKNPNGTVSVEVSSISADKAILTVKDFSFEILCCVRTQNEILKKKGSESVRYQIWKSPMVQAQKTLFPLL